MNQNTRRKAKKRNQRWAIYWRSIFDNTLQAHYRAVTPLWLWEHREQVG